MSEFEMDLEGLDEEVESDAFNDADAEMELEKLPDVPDLSEELDEEWEEGPVRVKTYDGWGTGLSSLPEVHDWEGDKNLEGIYENVMEGISENEELSTDEKIRQLEMLKEEWKNEFE